MRINSNILAILAECKIDGNILYLPPEQLDRKTYEAVNKCLHGIGGTWNRKAKGHVFEYDPMESLENLVLTGETEDIKKTFQFFPTPRPVAEIVCDMAELDTARNILEPSCGNGALADVIYERNQSLVCNEINTDMKKHLGGKPYTCMYADFLALNPSQVRGFDRIVMNPPFSRQQDIDHVYNAYALLESGGILVSVLSLSPFFRTNKKSVNFRSWLESLHAEVVDVEAGAFRESGTMVATKIVKIKKP